MAAGLVAFASFVYGGFGYLTSSGNPSKMDDAKQQIIAAILGLIILLSSFLILSTINPQLIILKMPGVPTDKGVILYAEDVSVCEQGRADPSSAIGKRGEAYEKFPKSSTTLWALNNRAQSIYFYNGSDQMKVTLYTDEKYEGSAKVFDKQQISWNAGDCLSADNFSAKSIKLEWTIPGIHLYAKTDYNDEDGERIYSSSRNTLGDFEDETKSIKFVGTDLRAILHDNENRKGDCLVYLESNSDINSVEDITGRLFQSDALGAVSSMTVFNHQKEPVVCNVVLYTEKNYDKDTGDLLMFMLDENGSVRIHNKDLSIDQFDVYNDKFIFEIKDNFADYFDNKTRSIRIDGDCDVVLFEAKMTNNFRGKCEVYKDSDTDMSNNHSNTCLLGGFPPPGCNLTKTCPCTSSLIILPTK